MKNVGMNMLIIRKGSIDVSRGNAGVVRRTYEVSYR